MSRRHSAERRRFLATAAATAAIAGLHPALTRAQAEKLKYLTPFGYLINFFETMYADTGGYFGKLGLEVEIAGGRGSGMAVQQVVAGNFMVSRTGGTDLIKAYEKEPSLVAIAEVFQRDLFQVVSAEAKPVRTPKDFVGKTVGLISRGGAAENLLDMMLAREGLGPEAVTKRETTGDSPGVWALLEQGRIDVFFVTQTQVVAMQQQKRPLVAWSTDRFATAPSQLYISSRKTVAERPEMLAKFLRGVHDTMTALYAEKDLNKVVDSMLKKYEVAGVKAPDRGISLIANGLESYRPAWKDKFASDPSGWKSAYDLMVKAKIIGPIAKPDFYTDEIRKRAFA